MIPLSAEIVILVFGQILTILVMVVCYSQKHATYIRHRLVSLDTLFTIIFYIKKSNKTVSMYNVHSYNSAILRMI